MTLSRPKLPFTFEQKNSVFLAEIKEKHHLPATITHD